MRRLSDGGTCGKSEPLRPACRHKEICASYIIAAIGTAGRTVSRYTREKLQLHLLLSSIVFYLRGESYISASAMYIGT